MKVINLGETDSALNNIIAQVRDRKIQKDSLRFRFNLERLGQLFAYEISKTLDYSPKDVTTPLATAKVNTSDSKIVAATILRAGLPIHKGIMDIFDNAESAFIAAFQGMGSIFLLTFGGPGDSTTVLSILIWKEAYNNLRFSAATTMAWYLGAALIGFAWLQIRFLRRVEFRRAGGAA